MTRGSAGLFACAALAACGRLGFDENVSATACSAEELEGAPAGSGSHDDPFRLCSASQMVDAFTLPENLSAYFELKGDLDLAGIPFAGIGSIETPFTGRIAGNGHTIFNVDVTAAPGQPAGFVNVAFAARIENLTLDTVKVAGVEDVGAMIGYCEASQIKNGRVKLVTVRGDRSVGGLVGTAYECQVLGAAVTGTVEGSTVAIGGIVGAAGSAAFLNIDATVDVDAPNANEVGGVIGEDGWSPVIVQNVVVQANVVGNEEVGGLVGYNGDGSQIFRSRMTGTVRGNRAVGGIAGANYDSPFLVYSTSVEADVSGNYGVGGFSGYHWYRTEFYDSYFRGTLTGTGTNQASIGGFFGDVYYYGWVERSYVDVTIDSTASTAGGFIGDIWYWSGNLDAYDIRDSFAAADVTGSSATSTISLWVGRNTDPNPFIGLGSRFWSGGSCTNTGGGGCASGGTAADTSELQAPGNWDFERIWQAQSGAFPTLRLEQLGAPTLVHVCPTVAIAGLLYQCEVSVADADPNETQVVVFEPSHSCAWLTAGVRTDRTLRVLQGFPTVAGAGTCSAEFQVSDGLHTTPRQTLPLEVHAGVKLVPADYTGVSFGVGQTTIGTSLGQVFTVTNNESVAAGISITGLPAAGFGYAGGVYPGTGGTCGSSLGPGETCTLAIEFAPTVAGFANAPLEVGFTAARGPVAYTFTLSAFASN